MLNHYYMRYPGFTKKALTLSYDDGNVEDVQLLEIMNRYGIKGTFNLNSSAYTEGVQLYHHPRLNKEEALRLFKDSPHEIGVHGYYHPFMEQLPQGTAAWQIVKDRENLEEMFGTIIRGMAYPMGTCDEQVIATAKQCGIAYARTTTITHQFELPQNWYRLEGTCRNISPDLMDLAEEFINLDPQFGPKLFYLWGHSFEFRKNDGWNIMEQFCRKMGNRQDIWYATNIEIHDYIEAFRQIRSSVNGQRIFNPTSTTLYLQSNGENLILKPGETLVLHTQKRAD